MREILIQLTEAVKSLSQSSAGYPKYSDDSILDNNEVQAILHCTKSSLDCYVSQQGLPYYKAGVNRLFFYGEVVKWLRSKECTKADRKPNKSDDARTIIDRVRSSSIESLFNKKRKQKK